MRIRITLIMFGLLAFIDSIAATAQDRSDFRYAPADRRFASSRTNFRDMVRPQARQPRVSRRLQDESSDVESAIAPSMQPGAFDIQNQQLRSPATTPYPVPQQQSRTPSEYYAEQYQYQASRNSMANQTWIEDNSNGIANQSIRSGSNSDWPAEYPFLTGDIFGISASECCDEWANHCDCLELTNGRSNCGCTNPYRSKNSPCVSGYRKNRTDCQGCSQPAPRASVSEYFHPEEYRR